MHKEGARIRVGIVSRWIEVAPVMNEHEAIVIRVEQLEDPLNKDAFICTPLVTEGELELPARDAGRTGIWYAASEKSVSLPSPKIHGEVVARTS
jgi:hypothetical protein